MYIVDFALWILLYSGNAEDEPVKIGNNDHWTIAGKLAIVLSDRQ